jgi:hypothetical protein
MKIHIDFSPIKITKILLTIVGFLLIANLIGIYLKWVSGYNTAFGFVPLFDLDQEFNLPTFYSSMALLFSALLLLLISNEEATVKSPYAFHWKMMGFIFIVLAIDEVVSIHNHFGRIVPYFITVPYYFDVSRYWVFVYIPRLFVFMVVFYKFFINLPYLTRISFVIAGSVFIIGAVGIEILEDQYIRLMGGPDVYYALLYSAEELFEMIGIVLFIRALVQYINVNSKNPNLQINLAFSSHYNGNTDKTEKSRLAEGYKEERLVK